MNLLVDQGNTNLKAAISVGDTFVSFWNGGLEVEFLAWASQFPIDKVLISNVGKGTSYFDALLSAYPKRQFVTSEMHLPFTNTYTSKSSQGVDRIAAMAGAVEKFEKGPLLTIVCGTCLIYDVLDENLAYAGGHISPGMRMRFRALKDYTHQLPYIEEVVFTDLEGKNTAESIQSGVFRGICHEIEGFIRAYREKYPQICIILSGGDARFFETTIKESIFVVPELQFLGLNRILKDNV